MRAILYGLGCVLMACSATGMAFLPWLAPTPLEFAVVGAVLSPVVPASWLLLSATADRWPRPRAGHILMVAGILAILYSLQEMRWFAAAWACYVTAVGAAVTWLPLCNRRRNREAEAGDSAPGPVRAPLGRRIGS
ncbi:MAG TPA: hypothetical protein VIL07_09910 [Symbiobacteriaceae bacterium]